MTYNLRDFVDLMMATFAKENPFGMKVEEEVFHILIPTNLFSTMQDILKDDKIRNQLSYLINIEDYLKDREDFMTDLNMYLNDYIISKNPHVDFKYEQISLTIKKELIKNTLVKYDVLAREIMDEFVDRINSRFIQETSDKALKYCESKDVQYTFRRRFIA